MNKKVFDVLMAEELMSAKYAFTIFDGDPKPAADPEPEEDEDDGRITTQDIAPEISIDKAYGLRNSVRKLMEAMGITATEDLHEGTTIKIYKTEKANSPAQVAEGEVVALTKITRKLHQTIVVALEKFRKTTTAEAIAKSGFSKSVNDTDDKLISEIGIGIKKAFFALLKTGTGTATAGVNLQAACAQLWAALQAGFEDVEVEGQTVFFVNPLDAASYLASAAITVQNAFGLTYIQNFLGMGTLIVSKEVTQGAPIATVSDNLKCAVVGAGSEVGDVFGYIFDETGMIGMNHTVASDRVSVDTNVITGVKFYAEDLGLVYIGEIDNT